MITATQVRATVIARSAPMEGGIELVLHHPDAAGMARPGQFFQLAVEAPHSLLRRPYSVAFVDPPAGHIGFLFNVVGAGSAWLSALEPGQTLDLIGPLGEGFRPSPSTIPVCVGGGLGIAAFPALVGELVHRGRRPLVLQGARTGARLLPADRFPGAEVRMATDDGSAGSPGSVVSLLETVAAAGQEWFVCGPTPMIQSIIRLAALVGLALDRIQVALETPMGCGMGICLACVVPEAAGGYLLACQDGPCVRASRVDWASTTDAFHG